MWDATFHTRLLTIAQRSIIIISITSSLVKNPQPSNRAVSQREAPTMNLNSSLSCQVWAMSNRHHRLLLHSKTAASKGRGRQVSRDLTNSNSRMSHIEVKRREATSLRQKQQAPQKKIIRHTRLWWPGSAPQSQTTANSQHSVVLAACLRCQPHQFLARIR